MTMTTTTTTTPLDLRPITYPLSPGVGWCSVLNQTDARKCATPPVVCRDYWLVEPDGSRNSVAAFLCPEHAGTRVRAALVAGWGGGRLQLRGAHDVKRPLPSQPGDPCHEGGCSEPAEAGWIDNYLELRSLLADGYPYLLSDIVPTPLCPAHLCRRVLHELADVAMDAASPRLSPAEARGFRERQETYARALGLLGTSRPRWLDEGETWEAREARQDYELYRRYRQ